MAKDVITAHLDSINMATAGSLKPLAGSKLTFEPLIHTSAQAGLLPAQRFAMMADPSSLRDGFRPIGQLVVAARVSGNATSAFAAGPPAGVTAAPDALKASAKPLNVIVTHAEGYASGELKHGPIALIDEDVPVIVLAPSNALFDKTVSNMQEVMARDGKVLLLSDAAGIAQAGPGAWRALALPACDPFVAPIVYAVPAQLLAYHTADVQGHRRGPAAQPRQVRDGRVSRR